MASETLADIVAEMRELAADIEAGNAVVGQTVWRNYADRIEAAWRRERAEVEANALSAGGLIEAMRNKREDRKAAVGELPHPTAGSGASPSVHETVEVYHNPSNAVNSAALHKAIDYLCERIAELDAMFDPSEVECLRVAFSAPARNCDLPLVVDGPANNNADKAWHVFKRHNPDAYFDVPGLLRCIDWLLAPAKEGDNNGSK